MSAHIDESTLSFTDLEASVLVTSAEPHYYKIVIDASTKYALDPKLIATIIYIESGGNIKAVSPKGAKGLMQLTPVVYKYYGVNDPFEVEQNIHVGTAYFALLLDKFDGNLEHALAAYNCGPSGVTKHKGLPPIRETRDYVQRVIFLPEGGSSHQTCKRGFLNDLSVKELRGADRIIMKEKSKKELASASAVTLGRVSNKQPRY